MKIYIMIQLECRLKRIRSCKICALNELIFNMFTPTDKEYETDRPIFDKKKTEKHHFKNVIFLLF